MRKPKSPYRICICACVVACALLAISIYEYSTELGIEAAKDSSADRLSELSVVESAHEKVHLVRVSYRSADQWRQIREFFPDVVFVDGPDDPTVSITELTGSLPGNYEPDYFLLFTETHEREVLITIVQWGRETNDLYSSSGSKRFFHPLHATPQGVRIVDALLSEGEDFGDLFAHLFYNNEEDVFGSKPVRWKLDSLKSELPIMPYSHPLTGGRATKTDPQTRPDTAWGILAD